MHSSRFLRHLAEVVLVSSCALILSGCGGGGGGGAGGSSGGSGSSSGGGTGGSGGFTLGATSASFKVADRSPLPEKIRIPLTVTGSKVAAVGAAFVNQFPPDWLEVEIVGTAPNYMLTLGLRNTVGPLGHHVVVLTVGTADSAGAVLSSREVTITYDLIDGMEVTATPESSRFVFGSSVDSASITVSVDSPEETRSWTITSNQPWLIAPTGTHQGDGTVTLTLNAANTGVAPGSTATAQVVVQNPAEPADRRVLTISAEIARPLIKVSADPMRVGEFSGLTGTSKNVDLTLDTGTNTYPWTLSFTVPQGPAWVAADVTSGDIGGTTPGRIRVAPTSAIGAMGDYSATAHFDVVVRNQTFRTSVPVSMKWHGQRLYAEQDGVAFSSVPSRPQPAARTLRIRGSRDVDGVPWSAASNQPWLRVTPSGVTGGNLTLVADPAGLASNTTHVGEVTLTSTSANIERAEKIRVAMWVGSTNPANTGVPLTSFPYDFAVNSVEPLVYSLHGGQIHVYNVYTTTEVATFTDGVVNAYGNIVVSSDGKTLYHLNHAAAQVIGLDAVTGARVSTLQSIPPFSPQDSDLQYARINGYPVLLTPLGDFGTSMVDIETGKEIFTTNYLEAMRVISPDGSRLFTNYSATTSDSISSYAISFGVLGGRTIQLDLMRTFYLQNNGFLTQMCVTASGQRMYVTNGSVLSEVDLTVEPPVRIREVPRPATASVNAVECNANGRTYAGLTPYSAPVVNTFVLDAAGTDLGSFASGPGDSSLIVRKMGLTGDARRVVSARIVPNGQSSLSTLQFYDVPQ